jgi:competence protein ComEA
MMIKKIALATALVLAAAVSPALAEDEERLNVNSATVEQMLSAVPGLPGTVAGAIVQYREEMGDIQSMDELLDIDGVNKDLLEAIKKGMGLDALSGAECSC